MLNINNNMYNYAFNYCDYINKIKKTDDDQDNKCTKNREIITTWKFDEEGNIVYYTIDKKTGEVLSKTKYKNPNSIYNTK